MNGVLKFAFFVNGVSLVLAIVMLCMWSLSTYQPMMNFVYAVAALTGFGLILTIVGLYLNSQKKKKAEAAVKAVAVKQATSPPTAPVAAGKPQPSPPINVPTARSSSYQPYGVPPAQTPYYTPQSSVPMPYGSPASYGTASSYSSQRGFSPGAVQAMASPYMMNAAGAPIPQSYNPLYVPMPAR